MVEIGTREQRMKVRDSLSQISRQEAAKKKKNIVMVEI